MGLTFAMIFFKQHVLATVSVLSAHFAVHETANASAEDYFKDRSVTNVELGTMISQDAKSAAVTQRESRCCPAKKIAADP